MHEQDFYAGGAWHRSSGTERIEVIDPSTEDVIGGAAAGSAQDVDTAVRAASSALPAWSDLPAGERAAYLRTIADRLEQRKDDYAALITAEVGTPLKLSLRIQVGLPIASFRNAAELASEVDWQTQLGNSLVLREPVGVVGAITPWNYPLHQIAAKVAAALAAGCTVVLKPSEVAPLNAVWLGELVHGVGLPAGVLNIVPGAGATGEAVVAHPLVDFVSFTGSPRTARRISELAARALKPLALELGGKSASVILDDVDDDLLDRALRDTVRSCMMNSGQTCTALTRLVVPRERWEAVLSALPDLVGQYIPGDPKDLATRLGPLISQRQRASVLAHIDNAIADGARLVYGGSEPPAETTRGYFVRPTVLAVTDSSARIAQEEVFGPVLTVLAHDGDDDAVRIANNSEYGLSGAVWAADPERAIGLARRIRTGQVNICGGRFNPLAPFGGINKSGYGREFGRYGIEEFLRTKSLQR